MPFLFVDYDHGAGGEYLCRILSECPQSNKLDFLTTNQGRTKIVDRFNQLFLGWPENTPKPKLESPGPLFDIVPTHRQTAEAKALLGEIRTIRISNPVDPHLRSYIQHNLKKKVLLTNIDYNDQNFLGIIKNLVAKRGNNNNWVKQVKRTTSNLDLILLSLGKELTDVERVTYIKQQFQKFPDEPDFNWDLVIPYDALFFNTDWVVEQLYKTFGLELDPKKLERYYKEYAEYTLNSST